MEHKDLNSSSNPAGISAAERVRSFKEDILQNWMDRVIKEIPAARIQTGAQLRDHLPTFMDKLASSLADVDYRPVSYDEVNETSLEHGEQRATLVGYSLSQMLKEYQILREEIISTLEKQSPISNSERDIILTSIELGMTEACRQFESLSVREGAASRILIDGIRDHAIIRTDVDGRIIEWNAGAEKLMEWKKEEVLGKDASIIFIPEDREQNAEKGERITAAKVGKAEDKRWHVRKDGSRFFANGILNSLVDSEGQVFGFIKVLRDDTELLRIGEEKKQAEAALYSFFQQSPTAMVILEGPDHLFKLANPPYEKLVGRKVVGKTVLEAFSQEEIKHFIPILDGVYKTGKPFIGREIPLNIPNDKGEIENLWMNVNYFPHLDENGKVKGILCDVHEVTDLMIAKSKIQESEKEFRTLANSLPQIIWTATPDGFVDWYSDWWFEYLGQPRGTLWDDPEKQPMHPDDVLKTIPLWKVSIDTGKPFNMEQRFKRGLDGQYRWHLIRGVAIKDSNGKIIKWVGANTDIHDHKILVQKLEEEREVRERFVAALSHDLRTPLTSAKLSAQVMRRSYSKDDNILRVSDRIVGNLDRVDGMIQDLLDASRLSGGEKLPIKREDSELASIVHSTVEELRHLHGNRFEVIEETENLQGSWDAGGIRRILENLCNNAVKYGDPDGPITISLGCEVGHMAHIIVHNIGNPISPNDIKNLFVLYKRTHDAQTSDKKGWGIGLMLVKGVVDAHGGSIEVTSSEKEGTRFIVKLPVKSSSCS